MKSNDINDYPDIKLLKDSPYLSGAEIKAAFEKTGKRTPLTIERIEPRHELRSKSGGKEFRPVLFFRETDKGAVLNATNIKRGGASLGSDPRKWPGKKIVFREEDDGQHKDTLRIDVDLTKRSNRAPAQTRPVEPPPREPGDDDAPEMSEDEIARLAAEAEQS